MMRLMLADIVEINVSNAPTYDYDYDYIMAPQRGRPYGANLGSMGRNTGTWSIRSECLSNITSWSRRKGIENTTLPFIPE